MERSLPCSRRSLLAAVGAGAATALAGCGAVSGAQSDGSDDAQPPLVDNGADEERTVEIELTVRGEDGSGKSDVEVRLHDRGGTPDDRVGYTGPDGGLAFREAVGPEPCNRLWITLPNYDVREPLGCLNGNTTVERVLHVEELDPDEPDQPDDPAGPADPVDYPVVDNGSDDPERMVVVDLHLVQQSGEPVGETEVLLQDRGGSPDDRSGTTGPDGRIRFLESVGPPPCNTQTVIVPAYEVRRSLGCNNGYAEIEERIVVDG